jgi:outer membrane protein assembly factor BamA
MTFFSRICLCVLCVFGLMTARAQNVASNVIEKIEFRGLNRVPVDSVRATIHTKAGDDYDEEALRRDFKALWDTGRFNEIQVKKEAGERGGVIVRFVVTER